MNVLVIIHEFKKWHSCLDVTSTIWVEIVRNSCSHFRWRTLLTGSRRHVTLCAYPSGRTIGGSIWRIRHGATEVLYVMDINLRKEMVLDGVGLGLLPTSPALLIIEGGSVSRGVALGKQALKRGKKDDSVGLVSSVIDTLRDGGNVLIPCESAGRALEIMQILGTYVCTYAHSQNENILTLYFCLHLYVLKRNDRGDTACMC